MNTPFAAEPGVVPSDRDDHRLRLDHHEFRVGGRYQPRPDTALVHQGVSRAIHKRHVVYTVGGSPDHGRGLRAVRQAADPSEQECRVSELGDSLSSHVLAKVELTEVEATE